eukprot:15462684-Alexandrium_andersonii.AAC.1
MQRLAALLYICCCASFAGRESQARSDSAPAASALCFVALSVNMTTEASGETSTCSVRTALR